MKTDKEMARYQARRQLAARLLMVGGAALLLLGMGWTVLNVWRYHGGLFLLGLYTLANFLLVLCGGKIFLAGKEGAPSLGHNNVRIFAMGGGILLAFLVLSLVFAIGDVLQGVLSQQDYEKLSTLLDDFPANGLVLWLLASMAYVWIALIVAQWLGLEEQQPGDYLGDLFCQLTSLLFFSAVSSCLSDLYSSEVLDMNLFIVSVLCCLGSSLLLHKLLLCRLRIPGKRPPRSRLI